MLEAIKSRDKGVAIVTFLAIIFSGILWWTSSLIFQGQYSLIVKILVFIAGLVMTSTIAVIPNKIKEVK